MTDRVAVTRPADGVAVATLNRPDARNALDSSTLRELPERLAELDAADDVRAIVLTGAGPAFCAGLDLHELRTSGANLDPARGRPWAELSTPLIGAINGPAFTGGLELALHCDVRVAAESAVFADTHTRVGLIPFWGLTVLLPQAVGMPRAREMSLSGRRVDSAEAFRIGLVNQVVPDDELSPAALALATAVASAEPAATVALLGAYRLGAPDQSAFDRERDAAVRFVEQTFERDGLTARVNALLAR